MLQLFYSDHLRIVTEAKNIFFSSFKRYFRVILKYKLSVHCTTYMYMATFKNQIEEYELTKIQEDDHTYDHIKMENALNLTWKQWFHICILIIIGCLVSIGLGFTVTRFTICGKEP